jgi:hypothetical protein
MTLEDAMFRPFRRQTCLPGYPSPAPDGGTASVAWYRQLVVFAGLLAAGALFLAIEGSAAEAAVLVTAVAAGAAQLSHTRQQ